MLILIHAPTEERDEVVKEFCSSWEKVCDVVPNEEMKTILWDFNGEDRKESCLYPACGAFTIKQIITENVW
jgi:hypothetical protein